MEEQIIHRLKHLYELEKFQIAFYMSQLSSTEDKYYHKAFTKIVETERNHANFFAHKLAKADITIPKVGGTLADIAGSILGESLELTGPANTCKMGVALEKKALLAYHNLIDELREEPEEREKLMGFLLEEEFHALWLQDYGKRLRQKECQNSGLALDNMEDHPTLNINMHWL